MYMDEESAFWGMIKLVGTYELGPVWGPNFPGLQEAFFILKKFTAKLFPEIGKHLDKENVDVNLYAVQYFMTVFLYNLPFPCSLRLWDCFLIERIPIIYAGCM